MATLAEAVQSPQAPGPPPVSISPEMVNAANLDRIRKMWSQFGPWTSERSARLWDMPANYLKGVLGLGPAATALAGAVAREAPTFAATVAGDVEARIKFGADVVSMSQALGGQVLEAAKHPIETIIKYPFELTPVVGGVASLGAKGALSAVEATGAGTTALGRAVSSVAAPVAERGLYRAAGTAALEGTQRLPVVGPMAQRLVQAHEAFSATDKLIAAAEQATHLERNRAYKRFVTDYGGLTEPDRADWMRVMSGHLAPEQATEAAQKAVSAWRGMPAQVQAEWINLGKLTPEAGFRRSYQPARIEALTKIVAAAMGGGQTEGALGTEIAAFTGSKGGQRLLWREVRAALPDEPPPAWTKANADVLSRLRTRSPKDVWLADLKGQFNEDPTAVAREHLASDAAAHRRLAGEIEARLQRLSANEPRAGQPSLAQMAPEAKSRRPWQMTRAEWNALPEQVRARKAGAFGNAAARAEDPYAYSVERAIRARWAVPREVLAQEPDWQVMARSPATQRIHALTEEVAAELTRQGNDVPMYFPFLNDPATNPQALRSGMQVARRFRPKSLRQSLGRLYASGELTNRPEIMAARITDDLLRYKQAEKILEEVAKAPGSRIIKSAEDLGQDEVAFSPDGLRLWRSQIDFGKKLTSMIDHYGPTAEGIESSLATAVRQSIGEGAFVATEAGFRKPVVYAINKGTAYRLEMAYTLAPPWLKPFMQVYDAPTAVWRLSVLALRPAWVFNNTIGNTVFSVLNGVAPRHYLMALQERFIARTPDELNGIRLTSNAETELAHLGTQTTGPLAGFMRWLDSRPSPVGMGELFRGPREAGGVALRALDPRRYGHAVQDFNMGVEAFYRRANFWKDIEAKGRARYVERTGDRFFKAFDALDELDTLGPEGIVAAIKRTNDFMADYGALTPLERSVVRRAVPFVNFLKHQVRLIGGLPLEYPGRFTMLQGAVAVGRDMQSYDNAMLPQGLQDKGLTFTGYYVTVEGRRKAVFIATSGSNPLTIGFSPVSGATPEAGVAGTLYQNLNPLLKWPVGQVRPGYNPLTGAPLTAPGKYEEGGKFYSSQDFANEVPPPNPSLAEYYAGSFPQVQIARHLINPKADFTGSPLSLQSSRENANRTAATELLKYFTPLNFVLVDQENLGEPPLTRQKARRMLMKAARSQMLSEPVGAGH